LAPHDLSHVKATGVVYVNSLLERVVEEAAHGDPLKAVEIRKEMDKTVGGEENLRRVKPGSPEALALLKFLVDTKGISRHYLEVGLGVDSELFTKGQVLASVGFGANVGIHPTSTWNNPEPEMVIVTDSKGKIVGCALGNDVNLRDVEGRSALLLGRAKDNNGTSAIGPFIRLFDESFTINDAQKADVALNIIGEQDAFSLKAKSSVGMMSRSLVELATQANGPSHHRPDGMYMFTGTMFAPTDDRDKSRPGRGFTHQPGDVVVIQSERLGALINTVVTADKVPMHQGAVEFIELMLKDLRR